MQEKETQIEFLKEYKALCLKYGLKLSSYVPVFVSDLDKDENKLLARFEQFNPNYTYKIEFINKKDWDEWELELDKDNDILL